MERGLVMASASRTLPSSNGARPYVVTFADHGRRLGLSDERVIDALCRALEIAGPGVGGRYVGPNHPITDDEPSRVALAELEAEAMRSRVSITESGLIPLTDWSGQRR